MNAPFTFEAETFRYPGATGPGGVEMQEEETWESSAPPEGELTFEAEAEAPVARHWESDFYGGGDSWR